MFRAHVAQIPPQHAAARLAKVWILDRQHVVNTDWVTRSSDIGLREQLKP